MKILTTENNGFCGGVKRAINLAIQARKTCAKPIFIDGELVHNKEVIEKLKRLDIQTIYEDSFSKFPENATVIVRAHGCPKDRKLRLKQHFSTVIDGTCPHVLKIANIIELYSSKGDHVVIIGDKIHPEVIALASCTQKNSLSIINSEKEISMIPNDKKLLIVAQSTIQEKFFLDLSNSILQNFPTAKVINTICNSSLMRQRAIAKMVTDGAEAIIIVGGKHSNNTKILVQIALSLGLHTIHAETADDLPIDDLKNFQTIGVVSGASTSDLIIKKVIEKLKKIKN